MTTLPFSYGRGCFFLATVWAKTAPERTQASNRSRSALFIDLLLCQFSILRYRSGKRGYNISRNSDVRLRAEVRPLPLELGKDVVVVDFEVHYSAAALDPNEVGSPICP